MKFEEHETRRQWTLSALETLNQFVKSDADFHGNRAYEQKAIGFQHQILEDGKYRVVFLGVFNVGKSSAINAFLGGAYLPMDVEECTSKLTFIQRGDALQLVITLTQTATPDEISALQSLFNTIPATVTIEQDGRTLRVAYGTDLPDAMRKSLEPLVTVLADEDFPHLAPLRDKIEEISLCLPSSVLEEDIVFLDTPGVHSVSETRQEITYNILEHSHLVIMFVDSGLAGNIHDLNFIKRIITLRGRRVFFVLNKADKLENDEIDIRGARGPAWSLLQAFKRHGIPEDSEVFFLSGYRALRAQQLSLGHASLEDLLGDNRLCIPTGIAERIAKSEEPARDLAAYLMGQSRLPYLKERLLDYLLNENKAGAVIETAARFIGDRASSFLISLDNELALAKDPAKFEELRRNRERLTDKLEAIRTTVQRVLARYAVFSKGGEYEGNTFRGYEGDFRAALHEGAITENVVQPLLAWLREDNHLREARRSKFKTLCAQTEHQVDLFVSGILADLYKTIEAIEAETRSAIAEQLGQVRELQLHMTELSTLDMANISTSIAGSYAAFGVGGALAGVAGGAIVGSVLPVIGTAIGAGLGALAGAIGGFVARLAWSEERWIRKLEPIIRENVKNMLILGGINREGKPIKPVDAAVTEYLNQRADTFRQALEEEVENTITRVQEEYDGLIAREEEIRREREAIIDRLEPKANMLRDLRANAQTIIREITAPAGLG